MDDLTAADYRLLLSLLGHAIVAPEQRERVEMALEIGMYRAAFAASKKLSQELDSAVIAGHLTPRQAAENALTAQDPCPTGGRRS
jgi:hypothetical protein